MTSVLSRGLSTTVCPMAVKYRLFADSTPVLTRLIACEMNWACMIFLDDLYRCI